MNDWEKISLNGIWQMTYISADEIADEVGYPKTIDEIQGFGEGTIPGEVPGNFELSLEKEGIVPEIFKDQNVSLLQKYEGYHVFYSRTFEYEEKVGYEAELLFEGIDTISEIWINGKLAARTENMSIPHVIKSEYLLDGINEIVVHLFPVGIEARKYELKAGHVHLPYGYASLHIRKAPHMYGWDIAPRIVSCGIYRPVTLMYRPKEYIKQAYLVTKSINKSQKEADMFFFYETEIQSADLSQYSIEIEGHCEDSYFHAKSQLWNVGGDLGFRFNNVKYWEPKGKGIPYLYDVTVTLKKQNQTIDVKYFRAGIRTVELVRTHFSDEHLSGEFYFKVNGEKVFILGTNFVPIDAFHSRDRERLPKVCELLDDIGCNAIRMWGGNVYEDDYLYDFCDEHGILIWQDFMMACGMYPQDTEMCDMLAEEVKVIVRRLRNHASIMMWAGDNEVDHSAHFRRRDPNLNKLTRTIIPEVLWEEDPFRVYLPSSPYIDKACSEKMHPFDFNYPSQSILTEQHAWGPRDYFRSEYYSKNKANFASEMGYHGCPSPNSIHRFLSKGNVWPWQNNPSWIIHSSSPETNGIWDYRIQLMADQVNTLFGYYPDNLEDFSLASQISQAEALKFFIEVFRLGKERRGGIIWWNLIDCWPQFSDAIVDYYYDKKLAYYYIKNCQKPMLLSFAEPENGQIVLKAINDTGKDIYLKYTVTDYESGIEVLKGTAVVGEQVETVDCLPYIETVQHIYIITWEAECHKGINHYLCGKPVFDFELYSRFLKEVYNNEIF